MEHLRSTLSRPWLPVVGVASLIGVAFLLGHLLGRPQAGSAVAESLLRAAQTGDSRTILQHAFEHEVQMAPLSEETFSRLWREAISPRLALGSPIGPVIREDQMLFSSATQTFRFAIGREFELGLVLHPTPRGLRALALNWLRLAYMFEYGFARGMPDAPETVRESVITGLQRDRALLEELGIRILPGDLEDGQHTVVENAWLNHPPRP